jgi:translation elongation factor EF-1alpha
MRPIQTNISICGHAKHGKSTVGGRFLYALGAVSGRALEESLAAAVKLGIDKDTNKFAMVFRQYRTDAFKTGSTPDAPTRLKQDRTVFPDWGNAYLKDGRLLTLVDTPGHMGIPKEGEAKQPSIGFLDNIVYGIYLSDMVILTVEASDGVQDGTEAISRIISSFSIPVLAVLVTKMDRVGYTETIFREVEEQVRNRIINPLLKRHSGYVPEIIPVSALTGVGFGEPRPEWSEAERQEWWRGTEAMSWYRGPDALTALYRATEKIAPSEVSSVRFAVEGGMEIYSPQGIGTVLIGELETGTLQKDERLVIEPASSIEGKNITAKVHSIQQARGVNERDRPGVNVDEISARALIGVALREITKEEAERYLRHGGVLGTVKDKPTTAEEISAEVIFFEPNTVYSGKEFVILTNSSRGVAKITSVERKGELPVILGREKEDGRQIERTEEAIKASLKFPKRLCIEYDQDFQRLTRFLLREKNKIVACGRCLEVIK